MQHAQMSNDHATSFNGLGCQMGNLSRLSDAESRSISAENPDGAKAGGARATEGTGADCARDLGRGWKIAPSVRIEPGVFELADIDGQGAVQQFWITALFGKVPPRFLILRIYWDDQEQPSVETPLVDFFCSGWGRFAPVSSLPICVNARNGWNSYWEMPFRKRCRVTLENLGDEAVVVYYQLNYCLTAVPEDCAYFHAQFRRSKPLPYGEDHTLLDGVRGRGQYVGTYLAWGSNNQGWWGEGEIKFHIDGDGEFPTICGTGTEDYIGGAWCFHDEDGSYLPFTTPHSGFHDVQMGGDTHRSQTRFGMYRWHIADPVRFRDDLRVTIQALGWRSGGRYLPLQDDIASVAFWYQTLPTAPFPPLPDRDGLEVI